MEVSRAIDLIDEKMCWGRGTFSVHHMPEHDEYWQAGEMAIEALKKQEQDRWIPCSEKPEYDFQNVLVRWHDKRKGCENDYYLFEGYVVRGIWCGMFEEVDMSDFEPIEWKPIESYKGEKNDECR